MKNLFNVLSIIIIFILWTWYAYDTFSQEIPKPIGYVNDFADVLTLGEEKILEAMLKNYEVKSTVEITVVTIKSLEGESVEQYAVKLFEAWGIGKKGKDNGLLILNSIADRKWRIEVGYGLEGFITDGYAGSIGDNYMTPNLKNEKYFEAYKQTIEQAMLRLGNLTDEDKERMKEEDSAGWPLWLILIFILIIALIIMALIWAVVDGGFGDGGYSGGGGFFSGGSSSGGGGGFGGFGGGRSGGGGASGGY